MLDARILDIVVVAGAGLAALGTLIAIICLGLLIPMRRTIRVLNTEGKRQSFLDAFEHQTALAHTLHTEIKQVETRLGRTRQELSRVLQRTAVVRYDAFAGLSGRLSFSAALLDDHGNGVVISAINGRTETRTYAKAINVGQAVEGQPLSDEEREAVDNALLSSSDAAPDRHDVVYD